MSFFRSIQAGCRARLLLWTVGSLALTGSAAGPARAEPAAAPSAPVSIGQVKTVRGQVFLLRGTERRPLQAGDAVQEHDVIETGSDGGVGITFTDNSLISAGPQSRLSLDSYRFDSMAFSGSFLASLLRGTMAVISGDITRRTPGAMKIRTPRAILGVRGTEFVVRTEEP
ncbi:MAG TPA: FecR domain-containing protein [Pseudomonadota bacterium]|nr:FecR domain-containing protein [Pseudomonadota bacterium]